jgi:hypothetical protein
MPKVKSIPTVYIGIDPGKNGGMAAIRPGGMVNYIPMPDNESAILHWLSMIKPIPRMTQFVAVLESVSASRGMGVVSAFTFGKGFGRLQMALTALNIPFECIRPHTWQQALGVEERVKGVKKKVKNKKTGEWSEKRIGGESNTVWKDRLAALAQELYPELSVWKSKRKADRMCVADALLIMHFCKLKAEGRLM